MQSIFNGQKNSMVEQFQEFKRSISGRDPNAMLQSLLRSGRYTQADVDRARQMAEMFSGLLR